MKEKNNIVTILLLIIIVILAVALYLAVTGKIALTKTENQTQSNDTTNIEETQKEEINYTYESLKGLYSYKSETKTDNSGNEYTSNYGLYLYDDGTFIYRLSTFASSGYIGNYIIVNDEIKLNYLFKFSSGTGLSVTKGNKNIKISNEKTLIDPEDLINKESKESITLTKDDSSENTKPYEENNAIDRIYNNDRFITQREIN